MAREAGLPLCRVARKELKAVSGTQLFDVAACDQASRTLVRKDARLNRRVGTKHIIAMPSGCFVLADDHPEMQGESFASSGTVSQTTAHMKDVG